MWSLQYIEWCTSIVSMRGILYVNYMYMYVCCIRSGSFSPRWLQLTSVLLEGGHELPCYSWRCFCCCLHLSLWVAVQKLSFLIFNLILLSYCIVYFVAVNEEEFLAIMTGDTWRSNQEKKKPHVYFVEKSLDIVVNNYIFL